MQHLIAGSFLYAQEVVKEKPHDGDPHRNNPDKNNSDDKDKQHLVHYILPYRLWGKSSMMKAAGPHGPLRTGIEQKA
jgi:hypothetical protein